MTLLFICRGRQKNVLKWLQKYSSKNNWSKHHQSKSALTCTKKSPQKASLQLKDCHRTGKNIRCHLLAKEQMFLCTNAACRTIRTTICEIVSCIQQMLLKKNVSFLTWNVSFLTWIYGYHKAYVKVFVKNMLRILHGRAWI